MIPRKRNSTAAMIDGCANNVNSETKLSQIQRAGRTALDCGNTESLINMLTGMHLTGESKATQEKDDWMLPTLPDGVKECYNPQTVEGEANRLASLRDYMILESEKESPFEDLTSAVASAFNVPWAAISFVDMGRLWYKALDKDDIGAREMSRKTSFCSHAIQQRENIFVVPNATEDERFAASPAVVGDVASFKFYAGVPLEVASGERLGTLCIMDRNPRPHGLTKDEVSYLHTMARKTVELLDKRKDYLWVDSKITPRTSPSDKFPILPATPQSGLLPNKHILSPRPSDSSKRTRIGSIEEDEDVTCRTISRPIIKEVMEQPMLLPDPKTSGIDPDTYLGQLVEAIYGTKIVLKTGLELTDFFPPITEEQMSAYSMDVVTMARTNDVEGLKSIFREKGRDALNCFNRFGEGLLNCTCRRGYTDSVAFLLSDEVNLNVRVRDDYGRTPLHDACWNPEPLIDICTMIMEKDPSLFFITDKRGYTAFQYARDTDWPKWRQFLFDRRALLAPLVSDEIKKHFSS